MTIIQNIYRILKNQQLKKTLNFKKDKRLEHIAYQRQINGK